LSACKTGVGKVINFEGTQNIGTQIMANGAKSVVSSLWSINDMSTSELMKSFYTELGKGKTKSTALANAKRNYLSTAIDLEKHPHFWAGLTLTGSTKALTYPTPYTQYLLLAGLALLLALLLRKYVRRD